MAALWNGTRERVQTVAAARQRAAKGTLQQLAISAPYRFFDFRNVSAMTWVRRRIPILRLGKTFVVTRREDVLAVLDDPTTFRAPYTTGLAAKTVLGRTGADHERHRKALSGLLDPSAHEELRTRMAEYAASRVAAADPDGMAVGRELVQPILLELVARHVGLPRARPDLLLEWSRAIFQDIFLNNAKLPLIHEQGERAVAEFTELVSEAVSARRAMPEAQRPHDMLSHLIAVEQVPPESGGLAEDEVVETLIGLAIGWFWHGAKTALVVVDGLLDRPEALALARTAAREGDSEQLQRVMWEVLRFRPVQVGVPRRCKDSATLTPGTPYETNVPARAHLLVGTHAAMWDEAAVPDPERFDVTRPDSQYLIFGSGPHRCPGEGLMREQLPAMLAPLLAMDGLARASGGRGRLSWVGPSPDDLWVTFSR